MTADLQRITIRNAVPALTMHGLPAFHNRATEVDEDVY